MPAPRKRQSHLQAALEAVLTQSVSSLCLGVLGAVRLILQSSQGSLPCSLQVLQAWIMYRRLRMPLLSWCCRPWTCQRCLCLVCKGYVFPYPDPLTADSHFPGNCKFGHKCALAHVMPGQPMSMDRKNKKAAQVANAGAGGMFANSSSDQRLSYL